MSSMTLTASAIRKSFIAVAASSVALSGFALAEDAAEGNTAEEKVERIQVTGSRIKRADMETSSPVSIIDASAIMSGGSTSIDDVLQKMTSTGGAMVNAAVNNGSGGDASINLRGLGSNRTLVLVNGRRMIASGTGAASTVDLNTIPVAMVERIEVLKDGASAIYGTDAIAGVVNIILKRDFEGFEMNVQTGISGQGDADESSIDFVMGNSFDKGNIVIGGQYTKRGEASQADRDFSECPLAEGADGLYCGGSSYSQGGHIWGDSQHLMTKSGVDEEGNPIVINGDSGYYGKYVQRLNDDGTVWLDDDGKSNDAYYNSWSAITDTASVYYDATVDPSFGDRSVPDLSGRGGEYHDFTNDDKYNYSKDSYLSTPMERLNLSFSGTYELSDSIMFFSEAMYSKRWSEQQMAPQPIWNSTAWAYDSSWMNKELVGLVQEGEKLDYGRRVVESGTRDFSQVVDTVRIVVGLEGEFDNGWTWDASYNKGKNDSVDTLANLHNLGSINDAVLDGTFDPFSQSSWEGESIAPYIYTEINSGGSELDIAAATLSGEVFELPAGIVGFAAGYEYRKESAHFTPDSLTAQGLANDPRVEATAGSFDVNEVYAELAIPLLSDLPFAQQVDLSAAMRYFDYSTFGSDNTWKLGLTWRMTDDLMVRGGMSTAFRAPTVDELYGGKSPSFEQIVHAASEQTQAEVTVGGNPLLTPEEADITTLGLVYSPSFVEGLSFTVDYFDIQISNTITSVDNNYIANQCMDEVGNLINTGSALCQSSNIAIDGTGRITFDNGLQNIGETNTSGYDVNVAYAFEGFGLDWKAGLDTSILSDYEEFDQDGNAVDYRGYITGGAGAFAEIKTNFNLRASGDNWSATYEARYIDGMDSFACKDDPADCYAPSVDSIVYHDLSATYDVNNTLRLSGGVNNILDEEPPYYSGNNDSNTDPYTYDVLGRYFFVRASVKF
ncbi:TonB-dependent receptor [Shewanella sp. KX20019]|uniref:TonB-dependent receptor plug domain-containing protein n=1 Tax=Shewanella sp. KX20019 TaxID=2803864 RepID=UPI001925BE9F|nr:TonB-dependent receptor [Shewanella sp. KX20019]QQX81903.1 TonB-dependent receptor [Shewanella sp. KX20019]